MTETELQERVYDFIVANLSKNIVETFRDEIMVKAGKIELFLEENLSHASQIKSRARPQVQRYAFDDVLVGLGGEIHSTTPKGEYYVVKEYEDILLTCFCHRENTPLRSAKHRKALSRGNQELNPQSDLFGFGESEIEARKEKLHVVLLIQQGEEINEKPLESLSISVVIPYSDWTGFHYNVKLDDFLALYDKNEIIEHQVDNAWPTIKSDLLEKELSENQKQQKNSK